MLVKKSDIKVFYNKSNKRNNGKVNIKRELIINNILNDEIDKKYYKRKKWRKLKSEIYSFINDNVYSNYSFIKCEQKGGLRYNYDFDIFFYNKKNKLINSFKLEFKYNNVPQFVQLYTKDYCNYAKYYYKHYVKILSKKMNIDKINGKDYLKYVYGTNFKKDIWFQKLCNTCKTNKEFNEFKNNLVKKSIDKYLKKYYEKIDVNLINKKFENQYDKIYMIFKDGKFIYNKYNKKQLTIKSFNKFGYTKDKKYINSVIYNTCDKNTKIHLLLRWKNRNGILGPAFQIKLIT